MNLLDIGQKRPVKDAKRSTFQESTLDWLFRIFYNVQRGF
ncbi:hypothetical protein C4J84_2723 [Pseudomonas sp. R11-23-07]|nr:hypothetical protein C4J86_2860 [Pseudomonas sp. R2-7-07]AZF58598.1 hypothetical protein C4J84_2723 [Pseudomonas sp. R11-23-07]